MDILLCTDNRYVMPTGVLMHSIGVHNQEPIKYHILVGEGFEEQNRSSLEQEAAKTGDKDSTGISLDDLTKIIVRKLKQDRANNGKIEAILKSYGVERVCELPQEKYESFITDVATL